ncbi:MAG: hypothetical protein CBE00_01400 [Planctomycetaceae bacterium TMED240]|nr:hypothetical protein [Rhodopirellula sp.]OUX08680.1 MAG: hypothetical protein CBE00_01400 [Planctomycetaceae bacterium TMED240]
MAVAQEFADKLRNTKQLHEKCFISCPRCELDPALIPECDAWPQVKTTSAMKGVLIPIWHSFRFT